MHVVQILPELNEGGVERGTVELNRELVRRGVRSSVISSGGSLAEIVERDGGTHVECGVCSKNPLTIPLRILRLRRCLRRLSPDVLHVRSRVPAWLAAGANRTLSLPVVSTVHGFNSVNRYSAIMTRADIVICGSSAIREHVLRNYSVSESKLCVVLRGIDTEYFDPEAVEPETVDALRTAWGLRDRFVVSTIGRITPLKGHDLFLRALARAREQDGRIAGLVVGGAREDKEGHLAELKALTESLGLTEAVRFTGSRSDMREILALSDLVVSATSKKPETFGRTAAEALAMNTPVVAARHGGPLDIVREGENGFFFEPGNETECAQTILKSVAAPFTHMRPHVRQRMSLDVMTETLLDIYRQVLENRTRPPSGGYLHSR